MEPKVREFGGHAVSLVAFRLAGERYAVELSLVERVVRAVALTTLPGAPDTVRGIFSLHGRIVPACDLRFRLGLGATPMSVHGQFIITRSATRTLGLMTEGDTEVLECGVDDTADTATVLRGSECIKGIGRLKSGLILIHDPARFLSLDDESVLDEALRRK
jgi:purine-binding chemotaxis protein CheW